jgi:hypothetical protein
VKTVKIIHEGLEGINLPPLTRPAVGPHDDSTEELVCWGITSHVYSEIIHIRTVLAGLIALADKGNTPSGNILSRHVFEWTVLACFMVEKLEWLVKSHKWEPAFELIVQADTGNAWAKKQAKNASTPFIREMPDPIEVSTLISSHAKYQKKTYGMSKIHDRYGFLSEYAHPNAACFLQYRKFVGTQVHLVPPPPRSSFGGINSFILEWLLFMRTLLDLAREKTVRSAIAKILTAALK